MNEMIDEVVPLSCPICTLDYTDTLRKCVTCPQCQHHACRKCVERYLVTTQAEPHCMECRTGWDGSMVAAATSQAFYNQKLREHHTSLLLDREKGFLPETVPYVEQHRRAEQLSEQLQRDNATIRALQHQLAQLKNQTWHLRQEIQELRHGQRETAPRHFVRACPVEGCRGFLSTAWKCGVCSIFICPTCHVPKAGRDDPHHQCRAEDVQTAELLARDTKPCPSCGTGIFKIDGCDQMWCTQCHTPFSWRTGAAIARAIIHNPHYFEWERQNGGSVPRNPLDGPCGNALRHITVWDLRRSNVSQANQGIVYSMLMVLRQIEDYHLPPVDAAQPRQYRDLRIRYMLRRISEQEWKAALKRLSKKQEKDHAIGQVLRMVVEVGNDLLQQGFQGQLEEAALLQQMEALRQYSIVELQSLAQQFHNKVPHIYMHSHTRQWVWRAVGQNVYAGLLLETRSS